MHAVEIALLAELVPLRFRLGCEISVHDFQNSCGTTIIESSGNVFSLNHLMVKTFDDDVLLYPFTRAVLQRESGKETRKF